MDRTQDTTKTQQTKSSEAYRYLQKRRDCHICNQWHRRMQSCKRRNCLKLLPNNQKIKEHYCGLQRFFQALLCFKSKNAILCCSTHVSWGHAAETTCWSGGKFIFLRPYLSVWLCPNTSALRFKMFVKVRLPSNMMIHFKRWYNTLYNLGCWRRRESQILKPYATCKYLIYNCD